MAKKKKTRTMPAGVKVISVLYFIGAALSLLGAIFAFTAGAALSTLFGGAAAALGSVFGIVLIGFAVLDFFIGKGLWQGKNWARIVALVSAVLGLLSALFSLIGGAIGTGIIYIVIHGLILWYLGFNEEAKSAFA